MTQELTEKAKENLRKNAESRKNDNKFVKLEPGEKRTLHFDPERIEPVDLPFEGKMNRRYRYAVDDPNEEQQEEKYLTVSKRTSALIDSYLAEGQTVLKIHRIGAGKDTQYAITPA
jgi:hypothetical protein